MTTKRQGFQTHTVRLALETAGIDGDLIPSWNESFVFDVASDAFKARSHPPLEAVIFDQDLLKDDVMASFSCDVTGLEIDVPKELWVESADVSSINDAIKAMKKNKAPDPEASRA